jgi:MFS family permease
MLKIDRLGLSKNIVLISFTAGLLNFGFILSTTLVLLYLHDILSIDVLISGLVITLARLLAAVITLPAGSIADRFGRKYPILLGFFLCSLFMFFVSLTSNPLIASFSIIIVFSGVSFSGPATSALISEASIIGKTALGFGWYYAIYSLSQFMGQTLSGIIVNIFNYTMTFFIGSATSLIALLLMWKFVHEKWDRKRDFSPNSFIHDFKTGITQLKERSELTNLAIGLSFHGLGVNMWLTFIPLYANLDQGFDPVSIGLILSVFSVSGAIFQIPFGIFADRIGGNRVLFLHVLFSSMVWWAYPFFNTLYPAFAYMFVAGIVGSMDFPARRSILSFISEEKFATAVGALDSLTNFVSSIGPFLAGVLWPVAHWLPFAVSTLINLVGLLVLYKLPRRVAFDK